MRFRRNVAEESFQIFTKILPWVLVCMLVSTVLDVLTAIVDMDEINIKTDILRVSRFFLILGWIAVAYRAFSIIFAKERSLKEHLQCSVKFMWGVGSFFMTCVISIAVVTILVAKIVSPTIDFIFLAGTGLFDPAEYIASVTFVVFLLPVVLGFLSVALFGTYLPAYVNQIDTGIRAAYERGKRQWLFVLWRIGVLFVVVCSAYLLIAYLDRIFQYPPLGAVADANTLIEHVLKIGLFVAIPGSIIKAFTTIAIPVILSRAYLRDNHGREIAESSADN